MLQYGVAIYMVVLKAIPYKSVGEDQGSIIIDRGPKCQYSETCIQGTLQYYRESVPI